MSNDRDRRRELGDEELEDEGSWPRVIQLPVQRRETDPPKSESLHEDRATIDGTDALTPAQARRAAAHNSGMVAALGLTPADLGIDAAPRSVAFAQAVARLQAQHGLAVDGIVGPQTAAALTNDNGVD